MVEMLYRERNERLTTWEYTVSAIGLFLGVSTEKVTGLVSALRDDLKNAIFQKSYTVDRIVQELREKRKATLEMKKQLERLDHMTV